MNVLTQTITQLSETQLKKVAKICAMKNIVGKILQEELKKEGRPSLQDFSSMLGVSYRTLYNVFKGESDLTFDQIIKASEILKIDLITKILNVKNKTHLLFLEPQNDYKKKENTFSVSVTITGKFEHMMTEFPDLMRRIKSEADNKGFRLE